MIPRFIPKCLFQAIAVLLVSCQTAVSPTLTIQPTAITQATPTETAVSTETLISTNTPIPATATDAPEPATATSQPTSTTKPDPTETAEATETAVSTSTSIPATATNNTTNAEPTTTAQSATAPPPPSSNVPAPTDNNYPANDDRIGWENRINVPAGFSVSYMGRVEGNPTSITFGPDGLLYVAIQQGSIHTMDNNGNVGFYAGGYDTPTGIAFRPGSSQLYVSDRVINQNVGGESQISIVGQGQLIGGLPCCYAFLHAANGIAFGPDGFGYVGVGARADHGEILDGDRAGQQDELHPLEASILRFNPDTGETSVYARGLRNPYDIAWDGNGQLWATDNAPDFGPNEELHRVIAGGQHGYPWYDCDVCFTAPPDVQVIQPVWMFTPHSAPTGITSYLANQFPGYYNSNFLTLWSAFAGAQKVIRMTPGGGSASNFATGFAAPIDVTVSSDGSLFVADWATGIIFKISYQG